MLSPKDCKVYSLRFSSELLVTMWTYSVVLDAAVMQAL